MLKRYDPIYFFIFFPVPVLMYLHHPAPFLDIFGLAPSEIVVFGHLRTFHEDCVLPSFSPSPEALKDA